MDLTIRRGSPADAAALAAFAEQVFRDTFGADNDPRDLEQYLAEAYGEAQQRRELADPDVITLLVDAPQGFAGYAQVRRGRTPACVTGPAPVELWRYYVAKPWQGRGLAQRLLGEVDAVAAGLGGHTLWLGVWERNARARAYYAKVGFTDVGSHIFQLGNDRQVDRILVRAIAGPT